jgi:hypothetical protein
MKNSLVAVILLGMFIGGHANADELANADEKTLVRDANNALAQKDYKTAVSKFTQLAEQGKPAAQFNLGAFYLNGQGVQKDEKQAFEWFRKSAAQGNSRALQVIEKAAAQGNMYAINELKMIKGMSEPVPAKVLPPPQEVIQEKPLPKPQENVQEVRQEKPQSKPQFRTGNKTGQYRLASNDPTVAAPDKWVYGISAEYAKFKATEPLYYPAAGGVLNSVAQSYGASQPGVSAWVGFGDITVMASFRKRTGKVASLVSGVGTLSKSFRTSETEFDVRWLIPQFSSSHFAPYAVAGIVMGSTSGTENEIDFQDTYSQKDTLLMMGAGAIFPVDEKFGFRAEGRMGRDKQKSSGTYVASPGVTLSFNSYSYSATATYNRLSASMYYKIGAGWNAQMGFRRGSYSAGIGPAYSDSAIFMSAGYAYR